MQELKDAIEKAIAGYPCSEEHPKDRLAALCAALDMNKGTTSKEIAGTGNYKLGGDKLMRISRECMRRGGPDCDAIDKLWKAHHEPRGAAEEVSMDTRFAVFLNEVSDVAAVHAAAKAKCGGQYSDNYARQFQKEIVDVVIAALGMSDGAFSEALKSKPAHLRSVA